MSAVGTRGAWRVPGRIEFLGKHTDYAGGNVLVGAVDRGVSAVAEQVDGAAGFLSATTTAGASPSACRQAWTTALRPVTGDATCRRCSTA